MGSESLYESRERYEYEDERTGFWRSLWMVVRGHRVKVCVTYLVTENDDDGAEIWTQMRRPTCVR